MEWISVQTRLPEMKEAYPNSPKEWRGLVFTGNRVCEGRYEETYTKRIARWLNANERGINVTHWMDFPAPPQ